MDATDRATIQAALFSLPETCRYHGDQLTSSNARRRACCDTGRPALLRREAEAALDRDEQRASTEITINLTHTPSAMELDRIIRETIHRRRFNT